MLVISRKRRETLNNKTRIRSSNCMILYKNLLIFPKTIKMPQYYRRGNFRRIEQYQFPFRNNNNKYSKCKRKKNVLAIMNHK